MPLRQTGRNVGGWLYRTVGGSLYRAWFVGLFWLFVVLTPLIFAGRHPAWRVVRVAAVAGAVVLVPWPHLTRASAAALVGLGAALVATGAVVWARARRQGWDILWSEEVDLFASLPAREIPAGIAFRAFSLGTVTSVRSEGRELRPTGGMLVIVIFAAVLRAFGMALFVLLFFFGWALVWMADWAVAPSGLAGIAAHPTIGDFLYLSVNVVFGTPPPEVHLTTRTAHAILVMEVVVGAAAVAGFASTFLSPPGKGGRTKSDELKEDDDSAKNERSGDCH